MPTIKELLDAQLQKEQDKKLSKEESNIELDKRMKRFEKFIKPKKK